MPAVTLKVSPGVGNVPRSMLHFHDNASGWSFTFAPRFWFNHDAVYEVGSDKIVVLPDKKHVHLSLPDEASRGSLRRAVQKFNEAHAAPKLNLEDTPDTIANQGVVDQHGLATSYLHLAMRYNFTAAPLLDGDQHSPMSFVLHAWHLLGQMETRMRELRRSYRPTVIETAQPRGKILLRQSLPNIAQGRPALVCEVDEFELESPHYSALMTVLEHIMDLDTLETSVMKHEHEQLRHRASALRWAFREHRSMGEHQALKVLERQRPPPNLMRWADLFLMAAGLLRGPGGMHALPEDINSDNATHSVWERILEDLLREAFPESTPPVANNSVPFHAPWERLDMLDKRTGRDKMPDYFVVATDENVEFVMDAKYKDDLSLGDRYQLFAYSMLHPKTEAWLNRPRHVVCLLPTASDESVACYLKKKRNDEHIRLTMPLQGNAGVEEETTATASEYLIGVKVPFPSGDAVINLEDLYWRETAQAIRDLLLGAIAEADDEE